MNEPAAVDSAAELTEGTSTASQTAPQGWRVLTVPNVLTLFRIASAPIFLAVFMVYGQQEGVEQLGIYILLGLAIASELSDVLDGQFARRLKQVSHFGKLMDPYADSIFRMTVFFCFASHVYGRWVPLWMVMLLLYRDVTTSVVRTFGLGKRKVISARISGKIKGFVQGAVIITALSCATIWGYQAPVQNPSVQLAVELLMWLNVLVAVGSGIDYVWANRHLFREEQPS